MTDARTAALAAAKVEWRKFHVAAGELAVALQAEGRSPHPARQYQAEIRRFLKALPSLRGTHVADAFDALNAEAQAFGRRLDADSTMTTPEMVASFTALIEKMRAIRVGR